MDIRRTNGLNVTSNVQYVTDITMHLNGVKEFQLFKSILKSLNMHFKHIQRADDYELELCKCCMMMINTTLIISYKKHMRISVIHINFLMLEILKCN